MIVRNIFDMSSIFNNHYIVKARLWYPSNHCCLISWKAWVCWSFDYDHFVNLESILLLNLLCLLVFLCCFILNLDDFVRGYFPLRFLKDVFLFSLQIGYRINFLFSHFFFVLILILLLDSKNCTLTITLEYWA